MARGRGFAEGNPRKRKDNATDLRASLQKRRKASKFCQNETKQTNKRNSDEQDNETSGTDDRAQATSTLSGLPNSLTSSGCEEGQDEIVGHNNTEEDDEDNDQSDGNEDPFKHFEVVLKEDTVKLCEQKQWKTKTVQWDCLGALHLHDINHLATEITTIDVRLNKKISCTSRIKRKLLASLSSANKNALKELEHKNNVTPFQEEMLLLMKQYVDILYTERTSLNGEEIRLIYGLHVLNHVMKTRSKIIRHNAKLANRDVDTEEYRDHGFTRTKVLILVPFRESVVRIVKVFADLLSSIDNLNIINKKRFQNDFGSSSNKPIIKARKRPDDYEDTFSGNTDDMFRIGISITKKGLKLYADFYSADIIIASPLGLRTVIGAEGDKERDFDFLSSIEILVLDQADVFLMQNWEHVLHIFQHLHLQPKESHGVDFSRVRMWCLNGWSKVYRQTIILSSISHACFNAVFNRNCFNYDGKVKIMNPTSKGTICQIAIQLPQLFHRFSSTTIAEIPDIRFRTFCSKILNDYKESTMSRTLIFIPSYFDFVRVRNFFKRETLSFVQICEYSKEHKIARARDYFFHNKRHFLLYTERAHFYNRFVIKGIRHIIFYELPTYPHFYSELCNMIRPSGFATGDVGNMSCTVLYTQQNALQLSAVIGTERAHVMLSSSKNVHMFVTSDN